jgi:hypothetical protein
MIGGTTMNTAVSCTAIAALATLIGFALYLGYDNYLLYAGIVAIAGIAGYSLRDALPFSLTTLKRTNKLPKAYTKDGPPF